MPPVWRQTKAKETRLILDIVLPWHSPLWASPAAPACRGLSSASRPRTLSPLSFLVAATAASRSPSQERAKVSEPDIVCPATLSPLGTKERFSHPSLPGPQALLTAARCSLRALQGSGPGH